MAGVGKLLKQAQKMQRQVEAVQAQLEAKELDVTSGGGKFLALELDPELLKEDPALISETLLAAIQDAANQSKAYNEEQMKSVTSGFSMPGLM
jgi:nucleoid-associated protein EbfC